MVCVSVFSFFFFFIFYQYFPWQTLTIQRRPGKGEGIIIFSCFLLPPANEHSFSSSKFQPLLHFFLLNLFVIIRRQLMTLVLLRDLHFICIFLMQLNESYWLFGISNLHCEDLSSYQTITHQLQNEHLNQLRLTPLDTTVYLSQLPNPTPSLHLSSIRLPKCITNKGLSFFTRDSENIRKHSQSDEIRKYILI